jgi:hypothetical protein
MYLSCLQIDINADASGELFLTTNDFVNGSLAYAVRAHEEDCMKLKVFALFSFVLVIFVSDGVLVKRNDIQGRALLAPNGLDCCPLEDHCGCVE